MKHRELIATVFSIGIAAGTGLIGCSSKHEYQSTSILAAGKTTITPARAGKVDVYDTQSHALVYSGQVTGGEKIVVDPETGILTVGARDVDVHLVGNHEYRIKFED